MSTNENNEENSSPAKTVLDICQLDANSSKKENGNIQSLDLWDVHEICKIGFLKQDEYAFLLCYCGTAPTLRLEVIILHLASGGREIGRVGLPSCGRSQEFIPDIVETFDTLVGGYHHGGASGGLVMTGTAVREAPKDKSMRTMKKKEKTKRRQNGKKKDGFQRGSSLFG